MTKQKTILYIDGDGLLTRAHYAAGHEYLCDYIEVGGVYTSIRKLRNQIQSWDADGLLVAFDPTGTKTFRHELYHAYKEGRPPKPEGLIQSKVYLMQALRLMGATVVHATDVEADDILATGAHLAKQYGWRAVISSHDKDLFVLAQDDHVVIAPPYAYEPMTRDAIKAKFGIECHQVTDFLALQGDAADNIPGVDLCGEKKAAANLQKYGTLEGIIAAAHANELSKSLGANMRMQGKRAIAFRDLMRLKHDVPNVPHPENCGFGECKHDELIALFTKLGFHDLADEARAERAEVEIPF